VAFGNFGDFGRHGEVGARSDYLDDFVVGMRRHGALITSHGYY
jgi:hypothetical protein